MARSFSRVALVVGWVVAGTAFGQVNSDLINEQLDKQLAPKEFNSALPRVMEEISEATNVKIRASPLVWDLLPWGKQTNVKTAVQNQTLREALTAITRALGLQWVLKDGAVELEPMAGLVRLGRRATAQELGLLRELSVMALKTDPNARPTLRQVLDAIDGQLSAAKSDYVVENRVPPPPARSVLESIVSVSRNVTVLEALESISSGPLGVTWYPWGKAIVVLPKEDSIRLLLQKPLTARYQGMDVGQALFELSREAKVKFFIEPGAVQRIPAEFRSVKLIVDSASVQQVLEQISATTGVGYVVTTDGVYIWNNSPDPNATGGVNSGGGGGGGRTALLVPTASGQLVVPEVEMPDDVRAYLKWKREEAFKGVREEMKKDKFVPPPPAAPATQPKSEDL